MGISVSSPETLRPQDRGSGTAPLGTRAAISGLEVCMKVIVLGAGVVGTTTAYYLNRLGCDVTVVDRQAAPAAETSYANGGQISVSHAEPWANPSAPLKLLRWLMKE